MLKPCEYCVILGMCFHVHLCYIALLSNPACARIFPGSSHTSDLRIGTPVATLPGAWRYRVSTGTGWPNVSIL